LSAIILTWIIADAEQMEKYFVTAKLAHQKTEKLAIYLSSASSL